MWVNKSGVNHLILSHSDEAYSCLTYFEKKGVTEGSLKMGKCDFFPQINISSNGPCILPLKASETLSSTAKGTSAQFLLVIMIIHDVKQL